MRGLVKAALRVTAQTAGACPANRLGAALEKVCAGAATAAGAEAATGAAPAAEMTGVGVAGAAVAVLRDEQRVDVGIRFAQY